MIKVELENVKPMDIEKRSFEIITSELGDVQLVPGTELIVKRCIHTSADFDYAQNLKFSEGKLIRYFMMDILHPKLRKKFLIQITCNGG